MPTMFKTATAALLIAVAPVAAFAGNTPVTPDPTQGTSNLGACFSRQLSLPSPSGCRPKPRRFCRLSPRSLSGRWLSLPS